MPEYTVLTVFAVVSVVVAELIFFKTGIFGTAQYWLSIAIIPVVIIFSIWDIVGILRDHWSYSAQFTTGVKLIFGMPIEELVFFLVVPICGLLTYEAVGHVLRRTRRRSRISEAGPHA